MLIKIISCDPPTQWYRNHIGETFEAVEIPDGQRTKTYGYEVTVYKSYMDHAYRYWIRYRDAVVIDSELQLSVIENYESNTC